MTAVGVGLGNSAHKDREEAHLLAASVSGYGDYDSRGVLGLAAPFSLIRGSGQLHPVA
jgi:hypothetical protein